MFDQISNRTWTIFGAVVTVVLGGALLVACGIFVYFFVPDAFEQSPTTVAGEMTPLASATITEPLIRTRPPTSDAARDPMPTFLPAPGEGGNGTVNTQLPPSGSGEFVESPRQSVVNYYGNITRGNYETAWNQLSDAFKQEFNCCAPDYDYDGYLSWWNTVERVDFGDVRLVEQDGARAVVYAELIYTMEEGDSFEDSDPYIELRYDRVQGRWLFEDKRTDP